MNNQPIVAIANQSYKTVERKDKADLHFQEGMFERGDGAVFPCEINLGSKPKPYAPGRYQLASSSFQPGRYGSVELRIDLGAPLPASK